MRIHTERWPLPCSDRGTEDKRPPADMGNSFHRTAYTVYRLRYNENGKGSDNLRRSRLNSDYLLKSPPLEPNQSTRTIHAGQMIRFLVLQIILYAIKTFLEIKILVCDLSNKVRLDPIVS